MIRIHIQHESGWKNQIRYMHREYVHLSNGKVFISNMKEAMLAIMVWAQNLGVL